MIMKRVFLYGQRPKGFTLIEIIIVAAIVGIFSGLATFGLNQLLTNNKMKAVIGETRQVGHSLIFAHQDIGFFPKIGFLALSPGEINDDYAWLRLHSMNLPLSSTKALFAYDKMKGPYFAASQTRNQLSTRFKSNVIMNIVPSGSYKQKLSWPADQWGNPYVLYLFKYVPATVAIDGHHEFIQTLGEEPDFWGAVVSYGPDGLPGSLEDPSNSIIRQDLLDRRLYGQADHRVAVFDELEATEYNAGRRDMYSMEEAAIIGITDPGSDDLIYAID
jgi:prepilin-type N-terminal cleavage/methylation domain-containing protein